MVTQSLVTSRLDFCNSLLNGISSSDVKRLQSVQNSAARLVKKVRRTEHISPVLKELHWLPIEKRIIFKVCTIAYKCVKTDGMPAYLCNILKPYQPSRVLRSCEKELLAEHHSRTKRGDRAFVSAAPRLWNMLPLQLRQAPSVSSFKRLLKSFLFPQ